MSSVEHCIDSALPRGNSGALPNSKEGARRHTAQECAEAPQAIGRANVFCRRNSLSVLFYFLSSLNLGFWLPMNLICIR